MSIEKGLPDWLQSHLPSTGAEQASERPKAVLDILREHSVENIRQEAAHQAKSWEIGFLTLMNRTDADSEIIEALSAFVGALINYSFWGKNEEPLSTLRQNNLAHFMRKTAEDLMDLMQNPPYM